MKTHIPKLQLLSGLLLAGALTSQAQTTQVKAANNTPLTTGTSWVSGVLPGAGDIAEWNNVATATGDTITSLGGPLSIGEIQVANNAAGAVSVTDGVITDILTLNGVGGLGIDLSKANQNLTIGAPVNLGASQTWNVVSGKTLFLTGTNLLTLNANVLTILGGGLVEYEPTTPVQKAGASTAGAGIVVSNSTFEVYIQKSTGGGLVNYLGASTTLTLDGNSTYDAAEVSSSGDHEQIYTSLTLNPGSDLFENTPGRGSSSGHSTGFTAVNRNGGSMADFLVGTGNAFGGAINTYGLPGTVVPGYATFSDNDWALPKGSATDLAAATYVNDTWASANNTTVTTNSAPASGSVVNSLRFGANTSPTLTLSGANVITSGGILLNSTFATNVATLNGGTLTSGNANADGTHDLIIINNSASSGILAINTVLTDNSGNSVGLTVGSTSGTVPSGSVQLNSANTFSGATYVSKGTLLLNNSLALQNSTFNTSLAGTLSFGSLTSATLAGLTGLGNLALPANFSLTVGNNNASSTFNGAVSGPGATLTKTGTGTLTLNGGNTYTGGTTVGGGTLALGAAGSLNGTISVSSGATLDVSAAGNYSLATSVSGAGVINGSVTLVSGGQLAAASTTSTLSLNNNLTLTNGTILYDISGAQHGLITVGGNLTLDGGTILVSNSGGSLANGTYKIIGVTGTITGSGSVLSVSGFNQTGQTAAAVVNGSELDLVVSTYISQNLVWVGDVSGLWNINGDNDWFNTGSSTASVFHNQDNTTFNDSSSYPTVNLSGVLSPASVTVNSSANSYIFQGSGSIGGSATLADNGSGPLTILTVNSYSGGTTIASGATVNVGNGVTAGSLGSGAVVDNSTLNYNLPTGTQTQGAISGSGNLTVGGTGTVLESGANTLSGTTTVNPTATLKQGAANSLPSAGPVVVNGTLLLGGLSGTLDTLTGTGTINNLVAANPVLTVTGGGDFGGLIEDTTGSLGLTVNGADTTLELTNATYTGATTIAAGTLQLGATNSIGGGTLNISANGTLDLNSFPATVDSLTGSGLVDDVSGGGTPTLTIGNNGGSGTFSGTIQNSSGTISLVKNGNGTETITGNNTYAGATTCNAGTLDIATGGSISTSTLGGQGFVVNGGTLGVGGSPTLGDAGNAFLETSGSVSIAGTLGTTESADGTLYEITGGTFYAGAVSLARTWGNATGVVAVGAPLAAPQTSGFVVNGPAANVTLGAFTIGAANANSDASAYLGAGSLTVNGEIEVGNVSGGRWNVLQVNGGFLTADASPVVISPNNGANTVNSELYFSGPSTNVVYGIDFGAATDTVGGLGWLFVNGGATVYVDVGGIVLANTHGYLETNVLTSGILGAQGSWSSSLPFYLNGTNFVLQPSSPSGNANNISLSGVLKIGTNTSALTISGLPGGQAGTVYLTGANQYNGGTLVTNGATLNINGIYALGGGNYAGLTLSGGALQYTNLGYPGNGSFDLTSGKNGITLGSGGGVIDVNGNAVTYASELGNGGAGSLIVLSSSVSNGVLTLLAPSTYSGGTTIGNNNVSLPGNGTLDVSNLTGSATGSGGVTVANGGALIGNGIISGAVEVQSGGALNPGNNGAGALTVGGLQLDSGSHYIAQFGGGTNSQTVVSNPGGFVINDGSDNAAFDLYGLGGTSPWTTPGTYKLVQFSGTAPSLDSSWTTVSGSNPHVANPAPTSVYSFAVTGSYLTVTVAGNGLSVAGIWTNTASGNWSAGVNWNSNPKVPHTAGDTATFGNGTALSTVTLDAAETVGTLTFDNNYSYVIANSGKTLTLDNTGLGADLFVTAGTANTIAAPVALNDNATLNVSAGQSIAVSGNISGIPNSSFPNDTETLTVAGPGTVTLSGNNTYGPAPGSVGTTVTAPGTLQVGSNKALGAGDVSFTSSGTLQAGAPNLDVSNNVAASSGVTLTINNNSQNLTLAGVVSGQGNLSLTGTGTVSLTNNNNFSGNVTLNAGVLNLVSPNNLGGAPAVNLLGGDLLGSATFSVGQNINVGPVSGATGGTALIDATSGQQFTLNGVIASGGNTGLNGLVVNSGAGNNGTVILTGVNTFNGLTVISNGVLDLQASTALQDSTLNYNNQGGVLAFDNIASATLGGLSGSQNLALTNLQSGLVTLSVGNNSISNNYSGSLGDGGLGSGLTKVGSATLTLSGSNSLSGTVSVSAGTLEIPAGGYLYAGGYLGGAGFLVDGGTLINTNLTTTFTGGNAVVETGGSVTSAGTFRSSNNDGTLWAIYGGLFSVNAVTMQRTLNNGTALPSGTAPLAAATTSGLYVDSTNPASPAVVNLGTLTIGTGNSSCSFREDAGTVTVTNEVLVGDTSNDRVDILQVNGGTFNSLDTNNGIVLSEVNNSFNNSELLLSGGTTFAQWINFGAPNDATNGSAGVVIVNGGSLYLGLGFTNADVSGLYQYGIDLNGGLLGALGNLLITNNVSLTTSNFIFQAADNHGVAHSITLAGNVSGPGGVIKTGAGQLVVNNSSDLWTGSTIVTNGELSLVGGAGVTNSPQLEVLAPGILDVSGRSDDTLGVGLTSVAQTIEGNGAVNGKLIVGAHGTLAPGAAATNTATLTVSGSVTLAGTNLFNLNRTATPAADEVVSPAIAAGGKLIVSNLGAPLHTGDTFQLFSTAVTGSFASVSLPAVDSANTYVWTNKLAVNGTIQVLTATPLVNTNPTNITASVSGNVLNLSWPSDHIGWRLLVQTNNLANGVSANTNDWTTVVGSTLVDSTNITINPTLPTEFYRLVYP
jgi:autotransporter-associated beta strand protein